MALRAKNRAVINTARDIVLGSTEPLTTKEIADRLVALGVDTDRNYTTLKEFVATYLKKEPDIITDLVPSGSRGNHQFVYVAKKTSWNDVVKESKTPAPAVHTNGNGVACMEYPKKHVCTYYECSDGNEFSLEADALRHELDLERSKRR